MIFFIHSMYENNLFIKNGIIYDTTYRFSKQYRCANAMWPISILEFTYIVIIYRWINATDHGTRKMDGINGFNQKYLKQRMCMIGTEESNNKSTKMNAASMICGKNK